MENVHRTMQLLILDMVMKDIAMVTMTDTEYYDSIAVLAAQHKRGEIMVTLRST